MTKKQEEIALNIISFLKTKGTVSRNDIAQSISEHSYENNFQTALELIIEEELINEPSHNNYKLTLKGDSFESFEKLKEEKTLQITLAKSNIEANDFQKQMAIENKRKEILNRRLMRIAIVVGITTIVVALIQVLVFVLSKE